MTTSKTWIERAQRHKITVFIGGGDLTPLGRTRNISQSGLFLETTARPEIGSILTIAIVWGEDTCTCQVKVARHASDGLGLKYVNPDLSFINALKEILAEKPT